jgi:hypothetical protein
VVKGGSHDERFPLSPYLRDFLLVKYFGWTKQQIDEQPAVWLDWMLQIHGVYQEIENQGV